MLVICNNAYNTCRFKKCLCSRSIKAEHFYASELANTELAERCLHSIITSGSWNIRCRRNIFTSGCALVEYKGD